MKLQEIVAEIPTLTNDERLVLIEALTKSLRTIQTSSLRRRIPASQLRGVLKTTQPPPTNDEIKQDYISYLEEKYS